MSRRALTKTEAYITVALLPMWLVLYTYALNWAPSFLVGLIVWGSWYPVTLCWFGYLLWQDVDFHRVG